MKQTLKQNGTYLISDISLPIILLDIKSEENIKIMEIWGHHSGEHYDCSVLECEAV
jgi:hypothetical protein